ncbi:STAS domain-containing protein [Mesobacillus selenatarsenatis]|uniref:RsbR, positive regulator of sigma-B n=1 Tax=Mesobacillus selenatarsenatis (strain DSM 18680 / JCM 14380 / FERM P-15431 / SF-1) TaxID=1321606 RepID=A0A0A8X022_MESS1|nr:STAS domain-containing protein [Mesobacillus selenatarsenatis]GAM12347.1 RsbR, positive regulator of sigma-B [Mesobacillus selenatarsenatis SF-1]
MNPIERFSKHLKDNADEISKEITDYNLKKLEIILPAEVIEQSLSTNKAFVEFLGNTLNLSKEDVTDTFIAWFKERQANRREYQFSHEELASILKPYAETRLQLIEMLTKISVGEGLSTEEVVFVNNRISYLLDLSITETMMERERLASEQNKRNQKIITELSSPIVPLEEDMAILPLIGEFDFERSDHIMTHVIPKISELRIKKLIIDFSGIAMIDAEIAARIFNINKVLRLIGIETMLTGIRPELAIDVINTGVDFSKLNTYGTVQQAILANAK